MAEQRQRRRGKANSRKDPGVVLLISAEKGLSQSGRRPASPSQVPASPSKSQAALARAPVSTLQKAKVGATGPPRPMASTTSRPASRRARLVRAGQPALHRTGCMATWPYSYIMVLLSLTLEATGRFPLVSFSSREPCIPAASMIHHPAEPGINLQIWSLYSVLRTRCGKLQVLQESRSGVGRDTRGNLGAWEIDIHWHHR